MNPIKNNSTEKLDPNLLPLGQITHPDVKQSDLEPIEPSEVYNEQQYDGMAPERTVKRFAFDVDGTLIKKTQDGDVPRYDIVQLAFTLSNLGHTVFVWSGGGVDYARAWSRKLGLAPFIRVLPKSKSFDIDCCFDDHAVDLAKLNIIV